MIDITLPLNTTPEVMIFGIILFLLFLFSFFVNNLIGGLLMIVLGFGLIIGNNLVIGIFIMFMGIVIAIIEDKR